MNYGDKVGRLSLISAAVMTCAISIFLCAQETSRVLIELGDRSPSRKGVFVVHVKNNLPKAVVFCTDFSVSIETGQGPQVAPHPFEIQRWTGVRWDTQLTGSDLGSAVQAVSIDPRKSLDFQLQLDALGRYRLRLTYLKSDTDVKCPLGSQNSTTTISKPFDVTSGT